MQMNTTCSIDINVQQTSAAIVDFGSRSNMIAMYSSSNIHQQEQHSAAGATFTAAGATFTAMGRYNIHVKLQLLKSLDGRICIASK